MVFKRFLSLILALLMCLTCITFTGCETVQNESGNQEKSNGQSSDGESDASDSPEETITKNFDKTKFHLGIYYMGPKTEDNLKDIKAAGIDFVIDSGFSEEMLDLFYENNMGVILSGVLPGWGGNLGENGGKMSQFNPLESYISCAANVIDHPAIWGVDIGDEPSALDAEYVGEIVDTIQQALPKYFPYTCLYPDCATNKHYKAVERGYSQLGTDTYWEYIEAFAENLNTDYICFDQYPFGNNQKVEPESMTAWFNDLDIVAQFCRKYNKSLWTVIQICNDDPGGFELGKDQIAFQNYVAMSFGAEVVIEACYGGGWFYHHPLNDDGTKTEMYDKMKSANKEVVGLSDTYMEYKNVNTYFVGFNEGSTAYSLIHTVNKENYFGEVEFFEHSTIVNSFSNNVVKNLHSTNGGSVVMGEMEARNGGEGLALMITDVTDVHAVNDDVTITFSVEGNKTVTMQQGRKSKVITPDASGIYTVIVPDDGGILVTIE